MILIAGPSDKSPRNGGLPGLDRRVLSSPSCLREGGWGFLFRPELRGGVGRVGEIRVDDVTGQLPADASARLPRITPGRNRSVLSSPVPAGPSVDGWPRKRSEIS